MEGPRCIHLGKQCLGALSGDKTVNKIELLTGSGVGDKIGTIGINDR